MGGLDSVVIGGVNYAVIATELYFSNAELGDCGVNEEARIDPAPDPIRTVL